MNFQALKLYYSPSERVTWEILMFYIDLSVWTLYRDALVHKLNT